MEEETEVAVLQCGKCQTFLTTTESSVTHKEKCWRDEHESTGCHGEDDYDNVGNTMCTVTFVQPKLVLEKMASDGINCCENSSVTVSRGSKPHPRRKRRRLDPVLKGLEGKDLEEISSFSVPRTSMLKAITKLQEVIEPKLYESENESEWDEEMGLELDDDLEQQPKIQRKRKRRKSCKHASSTAAATTANVVTDIHYKFKCNVCGTKFRSESTYEWHMTNIHENTKGEEVFTCPICGRMLIKRLVFQSHLKHHENAEAVEDAFNLWNKWPQNRRGETVPKAAFASKCKYCLIPHTSHYSFLTHMKTEHPEKGRLFKFTCPYSCTMEFDCMKLFLMHMKSEHKEKFFGKTMKWDLSIDPKYERRPKGKCDICGKMLDVYYLRAHKEQMHSDNPSASKKSINNPEAFPYVCPFPECTSRSKTVAALKIHFILHLENNPYACKFPGCKVKCDAQCHLDRHMKLHTGKGLQCSKCKVFYSRIDKLRSHICTYDPKKLKYANDGTVVPIYSNKRLKRFEDLSPDELISNEEIFDNKSFFDPLVDNNLKTDHTSLDNRIVEDLTSNEIGPDKVDEEESVVVKEEVLDAPRSQTSDSDERCGDKDYDPSESVDEEFVVVKKEILDAPGSDDDENSDSVDGEFDKDNCDKFKRQSSPRPNSGGTTVKKRRKININSIISTDPVFIRVCKQSPGFRELILGPDKRKFRGAWRVPRGYKYKICCTSFKRMGALNKHKEICDHQSDKSSIRIKEENKNGEENLIPPVEKVGCIICGIAFEKEDSLYHHLKNDHEPDEMFKCEECGDLFSSETSRRRHFKSNHEEYPFKCTDDKCNAAFKTKGGLDFHIPKHEENNPECPQCGKELSCKQSMTRHMFLIHGIKPPAETKKVSPKKMSSKKTIKTQHISKPSRKIANAGTKSSRQTASKKAKATPKTKRRRKRKVIYSDDQDDDLDDEDYAFETSDGYLGPKPRTRSERQQHRVIVKTEPELLIEPEEPNVADDVIHNDAEIEAKRSDSPTPPILKEPKIEPRDDFGFAYSEMEN